MARPMTVMPPAVRRNLIILLISGIFQSVAFGLYDTALPLYLSSLGISMASMGLVFGLSQLGILGIRFAAGATSERQGRRPFFLWSLFLSGISACFIPAWPQLLPIAGVKLIRDTAGMVRDIMRSLMVWDQAPGRYLLWIGRITGSEFFFQALGAVLAGGLIAWASYASTFWVSGVLSFMAFAVAWFWYTEPKIRPPKGVAAGSMFDLDLGFHRNLWILTAAGFIINVGVFCSHSFYLLLFFRDKFGLAVGLLGIIQMVHRFSLGAPMFFAASWMDQYWVRRHHKLIYISTLALQGLCLMFTAIIPNVWWAVIVFLLHDIVGGTFWSPLHQKFIQDWARPGKRGHDVSLSTGLSLLGTILGPLLAGWLIDYGQWNDGPFFMSGIIIIAAAAMVIKLQVKR